MECEGNCLYCYNEETNHKESYFLTVDSIKNNLEKLIKPKPKYLVILIKKMYIKFPKFHYKKEGLNRIWDCGSLKYVKKY